MKISCSDILRVISDLEKFDSEEDENMLRQFNLDELYAILNNESIANSKTNFIEIFNKYYHYAQKS
jgi:hypothetical protein